MSDKNFNQIEANGVDITEFLDGMNLALANLGASFMPHRDAIIQAAQVLDAVFVNGASYLIRALERMESVRMLERMRGSFVVDTHKPKIQHQMQRRRERKGRR